MALLGWYVLGKTSVSPLIMVWSSIRKHHLKAEKLCYLEIYEDFLHVNCLWLAFAKCSLCKKFSVLHLLHKNEWFHGVILIVTLSSRVYTRFRFPVDWDQAGDHGWIWRSFWQCFQRNRSDNSNSLHCIIHSQIFNSIKGEIIGRN